MSAIIVIIIFIIIFLMNFIKKVPAKTAVIIDRNDHYLKTVTRGFYTFNPSTDKVTTKISTYPTRKSYVQISETYDGLLYKLSYSVTYKVSNIRHVLESLKSNRRSVNDIIQSCVHTSIANFKKAQMVDMRELLEEIRRRLAVNLDSFEIDLVDFSLLSTTQLSAAYKNMKFAPHVSEGIRSIKYK